MMYRQITFEERYTVGLLRQRGLAPVHRNGTPRDGCYRPTPARFHFATPHHAWERGTNENTNGLLRQYLPKRRSMAQLTQHDCDAIATKLNRRPRKRLDYRTSEECYVR